MDFAPLGQPASEYLLLLNRGYSGDASLKLVGDRHRLTRDQRSVLYRGVFTDNQSAAGRQKLLNRPPADEIYLLDGYNVLLTIFNYLRGRPLFVATDGLLRDVGGVHGRIPDEGLWEQVISGSGEGLAALDARRVEVYFDSPVSRSGEHAGRVFRMLEERGLAGQALAVESPDALLIAAEEGIVCTSDSVIIQKTARPVFDLARWLLARDYGFDAPELMLESRGKL